MPAVIQGRLPGAHTRQRSTSLASNCVTHIPTLSPCEACCTGWWNICMDLTFLVVFRNGTSIVSLTCTVPRSTVPVMTVPCPLMGKQWSTAYRKDPSPDLWGTNRCRESVSTSVWRSIDFSDSGASGPPGFAATATTGAPANLVASSVIWSFFVTLLMWLSLLAGSTRSVLLSTTIM